MHRQPCAYPAPLAVVGEPPPDGDIRRCGGRVACPSTSRHRSRDASRALRGPPVPAARRGLRRHRARGRARSPVPHRRRGSGRGGRGRVPGPARVPPPLPVSRLRAGRRRPAGPPPARGEGAAVRPPPRRRDGAPLRATRGRTPRPSPAGRGTPTGRRRGALAPAGHQRGQVARGRIRLRRRGRLVAGPVAAVLVGQLPPAEAGRGRVGFEAVHLEGIDALRTDRADVLPAVADVELEGELLRPEVFAAARDELHADRQPRSRHGSSTCEGLQRTRSDRSPVVLTRRPRPALRCPADLPGRRAPPAPSARPSTRTGRRRSRACRAGASPRCT